MQEQVSVRRYQDGAGRGTAHREQKSFRVIRRRRGYQHCGNRLARILVREMRFEEASLRREEEIKFCFGLFWGKRHFLNARRYLRYPLAYEHVSELLAERGLMVDASCVWRWVQAYAAELNRRCRPHLKATNKSYRVDETYIKVKGQEKYLYRAVDSTGQTIDFLLTAKRDAAAAKRFFRRVLRSSSNPIPRVINVDKNPAYPVACGCDSANTSTTSLNRTTDR